MLNNKSDNRVRFISALVFNIFSFLSISQITWSPSDAFDSDLSLLLFTSTELLHLSFYLRLPGKAATVQTILAAPPPPSPPPS